MSPSQEEQFFTFLLVLSVIVLSIMWLFQAPTAWELRFGWWSVLALIVGISSVLILAMNTAWKHLAIVLVAAGVFFGVYLLPFWLQICLMIVGGSVSLFFSVYYGLAENNRWFTKLEEGQAKFVMKAGRYVKTLFQWEGHTLDDEGNVVPLGKYTRNGKVIEEFEELEDDMPIEAKYLAEMDRFSFSRAKKFRERIENQGIDNLEDLREAASEGRLAEEVKGIGEVTQDEIHRIIESKRGTYYEPSLKAVTKQGKEADTSSKADKVITTYDEVANPAGSDDIFRQDNRDFYRGGGLRFFSPYYPLYEVNTYKFSWAALSQDGEVKIHKNEELDYILVQPDLYYFQVTDAEDEDLLPLGAEVTVRIRVVNPKKAMLVPENWLEMVINLIRPAIRNSLSSEKYKNLTGQYEDLSEDIFATIVSSGLIDQLEEDYGVQVERLDIKNLDPPEDLREATLKEAIAGYEADAAKTRAKGEAEAKKIKYEAIKEYEPISLTVEGIEAAKESNPYVITQGLPGLVDAMKSLKN
ncbi:MAG: SPFH domain-containing protein [Candidatus Paceibacterota bacterium]